MRPGTLGFVGARLREGREARGLTAIALAELVGVSRQAISQYEKGLASPSPDVMARIAQQLDLPVAYFLRPVRHIELSIVFYRSQSTATSVARARAEGRLRWAEEIASYVREFIETPPVDFPTLDLPSDPKMLTDEQIETAAQQVRRYWKLGDGPISNVVWLLENHGAIVVRDQLATHALDAFSGWVEGTPFIVLGSDKGSAVRSRLDAAHELGHLVLHRQVTATQLSRPADVRLTEHQAFRFGGAFLLPASTFPRDFYSPTLDALRMLKNKWGASIGLMIKRLEDLELVPTDQVRHLWLSYTRRGWKRQEPLDDELPVEEPRLLRQACELMITEGVQARSDILSQLPLAQHDIEQLAGLKQGYLSDGPPLVRVLNPAVIRNEDGHKQPGQRGEIVPFPSGRKRG